ncbi:MAG: hypothetical protein LBN24_09985, partial [Mediterranea sp.]|jgi:hypothetical protein|nr:hypothetical protein [Mediterranea sp.]
LNEEEKGKKEKDIKEQIGKAILSLSQPRTYPMPHNKQGIDYESTNTPDSDPKFGDLTNEPSVLANWIFDWIGNYPVELKIAPYVLGKAITRFFYTLRDIEGTDKSNNLGDAMHRRVIAFFHAILLEDAKGNLDIEELNNLKLHHINPVTKDDDFTHNLNKLRKQSMQKNEETGEGQNNNNKKDDQNKVPNKEAISFPEVLSFSEWILKCPLLQIFVKSEISLPVINDEVRKHCVYDTLKKVSLPKSDVRDSYTDEQIINCIRSFGKDITYKECKNIAESKEKVHNHPLVNRVKEITKKIDKPIKNVTDLRTFIEQVDSSTDKTVAAWREAEDKKK